MTAEARLAEAPAPPRRPAGTVVLGVLWSLWGGIGLYALLGGSSVLVLSEIHWSPWLLVFRIFEILILATGVGMFLRRRWPWRLAIGLSSFTLAYLLLSVQIVFLMTLLGGSGLPAVDPDLIWQLGIRFTLPILTIVYLARPVARQFFHATTIQLRGPLLVGAALGAIYTVAGLLWSPMLH
jgi:hypothetical protein